MFNVINENEQKIFEKRIIQETLLVRDKKSVLLWREADDIEFALAFKNESDMEKIETVVSDITSSFTDNGNGNVRNELASQLLGKKKESLLLFFTLTILIVSRRGCYG